ncbi:MAG: putative membrane-bound dehydrogenase-like protein [Verrucomicrobiales bacterium]|jgi:putative membrane-bound dehydrogenase-like protein
MKKLLISILPILLASVVNCTGNPSEGVILPSADPPVDVEGPLTIEQFANQPVIHWADFSVAAAAREQQSGPIRVLFLGHDQEHHNSNVYYPMLAEAFGREAIYFDYVTTPAAALGDADFLNRFDAVLLYANHGNIKPGEWTNLKIYVENGGAFIPVHCASACFGNEPGFIKLVGGRFKSHRSAVFAPRTVKADHAAVKDAPEFEAWDETYFHDQHNAEGRTVLQVRDVLEGDPSTEPEPWTWIREQGKGRVFYTASGHDERVWKTEGFQQLLKKGILWAVGDKRRKAYEAFLASRTPLEYEKADFIPNYEKRPEPLLKQNPLSPEASLTYTQVPVGWRLELFASEPDIINPICLAWDERGRLWVAETTDYPNTVRESGGNDKIKILEDTDGDGKADKVTVFADGLNIPTSLTFANGGVIVAMAPHFLFLQDTDDDDKADVKTILFSGWGQGDTHAGPSNLRYGFDNQIWGSVGYSAFNGEIGGEQKRFGSGVFRFEKDGSDIEFIGQFNNNTWGLGFNEDGDVFGSTANNNPSFFCGIPQSVFGDEKRMSAKMIADSPTFHPITPNIRQVDVFGGYTAAAGHVFATSAQFPESMRNKTAFVAGPTGNLLGKFQMSPEGSGFAAKNDFAIVASADEWFSPVAAEVGPDGHLWIADWYNFIIQHNPTPSVERGGFAGERGKGNAHENPNRDKQHGRIYRLIWEGAPEAETKSLAGATTEQLLTALQDENLFWRLTAQRLMVERNYTKSPDPMLRAQVEVGGRAAIHALWVMKGLNLLDRDTHQLALLGKDPVLKRNAIKALGTDAEAQQLFFDTAVVTDKNPQTRLVAFAKMAEFPKSETISRAASELLKTPENFEDEWLNLALKAAGAEGAMIDRYELGPNLIPNPGFEKVDGDKPVDWSQRTYGGQVEYAVSSEAKTGERSLQITSKDGTDASWFAHIELEPQTQYRLAAWIKTDKVRGAMGATLNVHELQRAAAMEPLKKTNDWTLVERQFDSGPGGKLSLNLLFGGWGMSKGTAWWDDVELQKLTPVYKKADDSPIVANLENGKKIFNEHAAVACIRCHMLDGKGGPVGPPLDGIAGRKERDYLVQSLTDPQAVIAEGFLAEVSPMPPMNVLLSEQEFADVMEYLMSLK